MKPVTLEDQSLWYRYKTQVWLKKKSNKTAVVHNIMRVLRSVRNPGRFAYVSAPVTSGRIFYELRLIEPCGDRKAQMLEAISRNYNAGWAFVERLLEIGPERIDYPLLYPADLLPVHQQWEQKHFQSLWMSIIAEKCTEIYMSEGWEYSNGCSEEFVHVMQLRLGLPRHKDLLFYNTKEDEKTERERMRMIKVFDNLKRPLSLGAGVGAIEKALLWVKGSGLFSKRLENCLNLLRWTGEMIDKGFYQ